MIPPEYHDLLVAANTALLASVLPDGSAFDPPRARRVTATIRPTRVVAH